MKIIRDSIVILLITIALLAIGEFSLRLVFPGKIEKDIDPSTLAFEYDPDTIIALKPNITRESRNKDINGGELITTKTNSLGYRGEEIGVKKGYRIVVYGDSNVQARFSKLENTYPKQLERFLSKNIPGVQVINGGLVGAGPDQSLLRFIKDVDTVKPDLMILHVFADNDYGDLVRNRLFELDQNGNLVRTKFKIKHDPQISKKEPTFRNFINSLLLTRAMLQLFSKDENKLSRDEKIKIQLNRLEKASAIEYLNYKKGGEMTVSHFADHYDIDIATDPDGESAQTKIKLMRKILELAKAETSKRNVRLLVVVEPASFDLIENNTTIDRNDLSKYKKYNFRNLTNPIKAICESDHLDCVHLIDGFLQNDPKTLYRKEDNHWSDLGQQVAAKITAEYIVQHEL